MSGDDAWLGEVNEVTVKEWQFLNFGDDLYEAIAGQHVRGIYGPSGDVNWDDADPTYSLEAEKRWA